MHIYLNLNIPLLEVGFLLKIYKIYLKVGFLFKIYKSV